MATNLNDTTPAAPGGNTNVLWQKDGSGNVSAYVPAAGPQSGANVGPFPAFVGVSAAGWGNYSFFYKLSGRQLLALPSSWKIVIHAADSGGTTDLTGIKVLKTALDDLTVLSSTAVTFGSSATPSLPAGANTSDAISLTLDSTHDYWLVAHISNTSANTSILVWNSIAAPATNSATATPPGGYLIGDQTGVATIPGLSAQTGLFVQAFVT
jgi:hypothetical protein